MATKLTEAEIQQTMPDFPEWQYDQKRKAITSLAQFPDFDAAVDFITIVRDLSNSLNHHPDLFLFDYRNVQVIITTHEVEGVSDIDFELASLIDQLFDASINVQQESTPTNDQTLVQSVLGAFAERIKGGSESPKQQVEESIKSQAPTAAPTPATATPVTAKPQPTPAQPPQTTPQVTTPPVASTPQPAVTKVVNPGSRAVLPPKIPNQ